MATSTIVVLIVVILGVAIGLVYLSKKNRAAGGDPMSPTTRTLVALYLLAYGLILIVAMWRIATVDFADAALKIDAPQQATKAPSGTPDTAPVLDHLFAQTSPMGAVSVLYVTAVGDKFTNTSKLRFNQKEQTTIFIDSTRIQAQLDQNTIDALDPISIDIVTKDSGKDPVLTGSIAMSVRKVKVPVNLIVCTLLLTREIQLLLLAILAGALGSFVHSIGSFADFAGNQRLISSWTWWYITRPFLGAALAVIFYAVLRGGFMTGTPADSKSVNPFGVIAIGALVGMFADKASDKLGEIFDTLFKGGGNRTGKLAGPIINKLIPNTVASGSGQTQLKIQGDSLDTVKQVKFGDTTLTPKQGATKTALEVDLTPALLAAPKTVKVSVVGDDESPSQDFIIT